MNNYHTKAMIYAIDRKFCFEVRQGGMYLQSKHLRSEAGGLRVGGHSWLCNKSEATLDYKRSLKEAGLCFVLREF